MFFKRESIRRKQKLLSEAWVKTPDKDSENKKRQPMGSLRLKKTKQNENLKTENKGIYESQGRWAF